MILLNSEFIHWNEMAMNICVHVHYHMILYEFVKYWILSTEMALNICVHVHYDMILLNS